MTEPTPPSDMCFTDLSSEFDNLPAPSVDPLFLSDNDNAMPSEAFASDLDLAKEFGNGGDFDISFDDLDDLYIPLETDDFLLPNDYVQSPALHDVELNADDKQLSYNGTDFVSPDSGTLGSGNQISNVAEFLNSQSPESSSCRREFSLSHPADNSGNPDSRDSLDGKFSSFQLPDSDSCDRESSGGPVSSQGSGSGVVMNSPSPSSDCDTRDISSCRIADQNIKLEEMGKSCDLKRKKQYNEGNIEVRTTKFRKSSSIPMENTAQQADINDGGEEDEKRKARLMRNRESAQLSRQRKKHYVEELEEKVRSMHSTITDLSSKVSFVMAENATLRQQLSASGGMCPPPAPGMYPHSPMAPMPYPWMPYAPYAVKPQGSQVPLVPIPRLKPQQSQSALKAKRSENKKSEGRTKKVASISFLGLFFFIFLFGGLVPLVNFNFGDLGGNIPGRPISFTDRFYSQRGGKVWEVIKNGSEGDKEVGFSSGNLGISDRLIYEKGRKLEETHKQRDSPYRMGSDGFVQNGNATQFEPLLASLYVPRNDKLVKIDGNLIINSVLATEKAKASQTFHAENNLRETGLAISKDWDSALAIPEVGRNRDSHPHLYRSPPEQRKALASGSAETLKDHIKSTATDGKLQKWFHEGLAGPMLSSGMCSEVFQFDASPAPGAIVPASSIANVSAVNHQNDTSINKSRNRRFLDKTPRSLARSGLNACEERVRNPQNEELHGNKSVSSMVVSVLVDPKEVGDNGDVDGMMQHKSLSRIFVVVLIDSVKYVTYSCGLPRISPHLVTA